MFLCRKITGAPFELIGAHFNRDHSTVTHAYQLIERRMLRDAAFRLFIEKLEGQITGRSRQPRRQPREGTMERTIEPRPVQ